MERGCKVVSVWMRGAQMKNDEKEDEALVPVEVQDVAKTDVFDRFLEQIRPEWQSRSLITRVRRLLKVDPALHVSVCSMQQYMI